MGRIGNPCGASPAWGGGLDPAWALQLDNCFNRPKGPPRGLSARSVRPWSRRGPTSRSAGNPCAAGWPGGPETRPPANETGPWVPGHWSERPFCAKMISGSVKGDGWPGLERSEVPAIPAQVTRGDCPKPRFILLLMVAKAVSPWFHLRTRNRRAPAGRPGPLHLRRSIEGIQGAEFPGPET